LALPIYRKDQHYKRRYYKAILQDTKAYKRNKHKVIVNMELYLYIAILSSV